MLVGVSWRRSGYLLGNEEEAEMSDADDQMGGHGGETGKDPADQSNAAPDPITGNTGKGEPDDTGDAPDDLPVDGKPQGDEQAEENRQNEPPA